MRKVVAAVLLIQAAVALPLALEARAAEAQRVPLVKAVLNYEKPNSRAADAFFDALRKHSGKVISLTLEIVPKQDKNGAGYGLSKEGPPAPNTAHILCGQENYGTIDNYRTAYRLGFQHPEHFHAPAEIIVGERTRYPFHSLRCGVEAYTTKELTHLHVQGQFVVMTADIPTANTYTLYPYYAP